MQRRTSRVQRQHTRRIRRLIAQSQERLHDEESPSIVRLKHLHELALHLVDYNIRLAVDARQEGATWQEIGDAVGISPAAAHRRYNQFTKPS